MKNNIDSCVEMYSKSEMKSVEKYICKNFGKFTDVFHEVFSPDIHVDICLIPPAKKRNYYTLVTMGMGAHKMNVPEELSQYKLERAELLITLPADWKIVDKDEKWYWPIRLLKNIARLPIEEDTWIGWGHTVDNTKPYAENTKLSGALIVAPEAGERKSETCKLPDKSEVNFYQIIPLYNEEMEYKIAHDANALLELMDNVSFVVDIHRPNTAEAYNVGEYSFKQIILDDVKYHKESIYEKNLPVEEIATYNHLAIYLRWFMEKGLMSEMFMSKYADTVKAVQEKSGSIPDLRVVLRDNDDLNGYLMLPYFNEKGISFSEWYYDSSDTEHNFPCDIDSYAEKYFGTERYNSDEFQDEAYLFVPWTEKYYQNMARIMDQRYKQWHNIHFENDEKEDYQFNVRLNLNARLMPADRHKLEDALEYVLNFQRLGTVDGGGTLQLPSGEIKSCDIELCVIDDSEETFDLLVKMINNIGVPKGSKLITDTRTVSIGEQEGLALYLDGRELSEEIYKTCDVNYVIEQTNSLMEGIGMMYSYWEGDENTALYFYGSSYDKMLSAIKDFLEKYPLCQKCTVKRIA